MNYFRLETGTTSYYTIMLDKADILCNLNFENELSDKFITSKKHLKRFFLLCRCHISLILFWDMSKSIILTCFSIFSKKWNHFKLDHPVMELTLYKCDSTVKKL